MYKCVIASCIYLVNNFYKQPVRFFDRNYISSLKEDSRIKAARAESSRSAFVSGKLFDLVAEWGFIRECTKGQLLIILLPYRLVAAAITLVVRLVIQNTIMQFLFITSFSRYPFITLTVLKACFSSSLAASQAK